MLQFPWILIIWEEREHEEDIPISSWIDGETDSCGTWGNNSVAASTNNLCSSYKMNRHRSDVFRTDVDDDDDVAGDCNHSPLSPPLHIAFCWLHTQFLNLHGLSCTCRDSIPLLRLQQYQFHILLNILESRFGDARPSIPACLNDPRPQSRPHVTGFPVITRSQENKTR